MSIIVTDPEDEINVNEEIDLEDLIDQMGKILAEEYIALANE